MTTKTHDEAWAAKLLDTTTDQILAFTQKDDETWVVVTAYGAHAELTDSGDVTYIAGGASAGAEGVAAVAPAPELPPTTDDTPDELPQLEDETTPPPLDETPPEVDPGTGEDTTGDTDPTTSDADYYEVFKGGDKTWFFHRAHADGDVVSVSTDTYKTRKQAIAEAENEAASEGLEVRVDTKN